MVIKYRLHEVAKDMNLQNKDVIDLLANYSDTPKKHMTALTDEELNIVFDYFTQQKQVENFDAYFKDTTKTTAAAPEKEVAKADPVMEEESAPEAPKPAVPKPEAKQPPKPQRAPRPAAAPGKPPKPAARPAAQNRPQQAGQNASQPQACLLYTSRCV